MSMKKTDLEKQLAKKIDGRMNKRGMSQRFGAGAAAAGAKAKLAGADAALAAGERPAAAKLVPVSFRLPSDLVQRLRAEAAAREGGLSAVMTMAAEQWLASREGGEKA